MTGIKAFHDNNHSPPGMTKIIYKNDDYHFHYELSFIPLVYQND
jgi:hypothetical protein